MSEDKCNCFWCQKGVVGEEAKKRDLDFLTGVIHFATLKLFECGEEMATQISSTGGAEIARKMVEEEYSNEALRDDIYDLYFDNINMGSSRRSAMIGKMHEVLKVLAHASGCLGGDRRIKETPVLEGMVTPETFINYELSGVEFPENVMAIYKEVAASRATAGIAEVLERLKEDLSTGMGFSPPPGKTLH